jgi:hypothetical protein
MVLCSLIVAIILEEPVALIFKIEDKYLYTEDEGCRLH